MRVTAGVVRDSGQDGQAVPEHVAPVAEDAECNPRQEIRPGPQLRGGQAGEVARLLASERIVGAMHICEATQWRALSRSEMVDASSS